MKGIRKNGYSFYTSLLTKERKVHTVKICTTGIRKSVTNKKKEDTSYYLGAKISLRSKTGILCLKYTCLQKSTAPLGTEGQYSRHSNQIKRELYIREALLPLWGAHMLAQ